MSSIVFIGWKPPVPAGRDFDLYSMLPQVNRDQDKGGDLLRFCSILQEVTDLLLFDVDKFAQLSDPDLAPENFVDAMRDDLADPFDFPLELIDKRRLVNLLLAMYQQKGTNQGMVNVVRFFMGITISIDEIAFTGLLWSLDISILDVDTRLTTGDARIRNTFDVIVTTTLTADQLAQLVQIVNFMKPAWTHLRHVVQPSTPPVYDPVVMDVSLLDVDWLLH